MEKQVKRRRHRQQIRVVALNEPDPGRFAKALLKYVFDVPVELSDEEEFERRMRELETNPISQTGEKLDD